MTRILYIGNTSENHVPKTPGFSPEHSTENHVKTALRNLGHECLPVLEFELDWSTVPGLVNQNQPDMLLWTRTGSFDSDRQLQRSVIKGLNIPTVGFHLDRWWGLRRENTEGGPADPNRTPFFDCTYVFTADGGHDEQWQAAGINHYWSPPAILSDEAKRVGVYREEYASPIGFVGNLRRYAHPEWGPYRLSLFKFLVKTYGSRFRLWEGGIRGQDLADLYASVKVLVGDSCLAGGATRYLSDRIPESLGRGAFLIHPRVVGVTDGTLYQEEAHLACYELGDFTALQYEINFHLQNEKPTRMVADAGRAHVLERHLYEHRMERLLSIVLP